eukprot:9164830-Alexandrium_andersonii.AAC.1
MRSPGFSIATPTRLCKHSLAKWTLRCEKNAPRRISQISTGVNTCFGKPRGRSQPRRGLGHG